MKKTTWTIVTVILVCFFSFHVFAEEKTAILPIDDYVIGPGDEVNLNTEIDAMSMRREAMRQNSQNDKSSTYD